MLTDKQIREMYELHDDAGNAESVNDAFSACQKVILGYGLRIANDDNAENLVTAITRYVLESGNLHL